MDKNEVKRNVKLRSNYFSVKVSILATVFRRQISKSQQFQAKLSEFCRRNTKASTETFTEK